MQLEFSASEYLLVELTLAERDPKIVGILCVCVCVCVWVCVCVGGCVVGVCVCVCAQMVGHAPSEDRGSSWWGCASRLTNPDPISDPKLAFSTPVSRRSPNRSSIFERAPNLFLSLTMPKNDRNLQIVQTPTLKS